MIRHLKKQSQFQELGAPVLQCLQSSTMSIVGTATITDVWSHEHSDKPQPSFLNCRRLRSAAPAVPHVACDVAARRIQPNL